MLPAFVRPLAGAVFVALLTQIAHARPEGLALDAPVTPLTAPVQIVTTVAAPFRELCSTRWRTLQNGQPSTGTPTPECTEVTISPEGNSGAVRITMQGRITINYTRSATGAASNFSATGPGMDLEPAHRRLEDSIVGQSLLRQTVAQDQVLPPNRRVIGRSIVRGRPVLVTQSSPYQSNLTDRIVTVKTQNAIDIETGMPVESLTDILIVNKDTGTPIEHNVLVISTR